MSQTSLNSFAFHQNGHKSNFLFYVFFKYENKDMDGSIIIKAFDIC